MNNGNAQIPFSWQCRINCLEEILANFLRDAGNGDVAGAIAFAIADIMRLEDSYFTWDETGDQLRKERQLP